MSKLIKPGDFHRCVSVMREFFLSRGFIEVHPQSAQSILAACEDPSTISTYHYGGKKQCNNLIAEPIDQTIWPLPQTGQMWLEHVLLDNPNIEGCFAVTTSYRNEQNPIEGRHESIFPMFEFESKGDMNDLIKLEKDLLNWIGFTSNSTGRQDVIVTDGTGSATGIMKQYNKMVNNGCNGFDEKEYKRDLIEHDSHGPNLRCKKNAYYDYPGGDYIDVARRYGVEIIDDREEDLLCKEFGPVFFLKNFPVITSPFWNMKMDGYVSKKVDVILHGQETIGSAERSCDKDEMKHMFHTISDGDYANILYGKFTKERVDKEFEDFMKKDFFPRYGGGIGMTRMIRAMKKSNLIQV